MKLRIKETQEVKDLEIRDRNGVEWTNDLLGNYDALKFNKETEEYEMSQEAYEFWSEYIKNHVSDEREVIELAEELGIEESEIWERIHYTLNLDIGNEHIIIQKVLEEIRKECGIY